jgi:hypothetical protein
MIAEKEILPTPESIAKYVKQNAQRQKTSSSMKAMTHDRGGQEITREDDYKGHHIVVRTKYDISVDGHVVTGHIMLTNMGQVQYHGLPNYSFDSAVELARALIDNFPEDFAEKSGTSSSVREGSKTSMNGMKMSGRRGTKLAKLKSKRVKGKSK